MPKETIYYDNDPDGYWLRSEKSSSGQLNEYAGRSDGSHCHMWYNPSTGERGVEHRGACRVCEDSSRSGK